MRIHLDNGRPDDDVTLLDALCRLSGRQGGTIHQYLDSGSRFFGSLVAAFKHCRKCGITFESRASLEKLAAQHHMRIAWDGSNSPAEYWPEPSDSTWGEH